MRELRMYIVTACISFTLVMLISSISKDLGLMSNVINQMYTYETFAVCLSVSGLMCITDYFMQNKSEKAIFFVRMLDMYIVVFTANILLFNMWELSIATLLFNAVLLLIVFSSVYILLYLRNKSDEININKKLKERNKK